MVQRDGSWVLAPVPQHRVDDAPGTADLVGPDEEGGVADERVEDDALVGVDGRLLEALVGEVHRRLLHPEGVARDLGAEPQAEPLVGRDAHDERVRLQVGSGAGEQWQLRWPVELHGDLGDAGGQPLAGADVHRDAVPAPVVDVQAQRDERLGGTERVHARLLAVPGHEVLAGAAPGVLAADGVGGDVRLLVQWADGAQQLDLLVPDRLRVERGRWLHEEQRQDLQHVVLHDVAHRTGRLVEATPLTDTQSLGDGDLHVVDPGPVPDGLEDRVGEAEREEVLHRLLGQVVVDPEDLFLPERRGEVGVQVPRAGLVPAERLLDDRPDETVAVRGSQAGLAEAEGDRTEQTRRHREVVDTVARRPVVAITLGEHLGQPLVGRRIVIPTVDVADRFRELLPPGVPVTGDTRTAVLGELVVRHRGAGHPDQRDLARQSAVRGQPLQRGQQLAGGQVTRGAEDHQTACR